ncbi:hypothetical protein Dpep_1066 [Dethiosulfovibrio peptidovorans DSM 11002]|uniref:Sodium-dependent transporter n=1 Tax=Dethiosulfovibrio peptidovorans DSM 11002 TaxID=469381 RepID=D2Z6J5_9BACT|nr:hypothetical protein Dpep_1066 [Dethiosulfovibrio peptidovorans DSM 11002]
MAFYLKPDFSKVTGATVIDALGQAFYSLSLGMGFLDGLDWLCNNLLLTTCGILICLFAGWVVGDRMKKEVTNDGSRLFALLFPWTWILRVVAPAAILVIIYNGLK